MTRTTTRAVQLVEPGQPLQLRRAPLAPLGPADALVRVKAAGICHTDEHYRAGGFEFRSLPVTLGHEVAGVVERAGARAGPFRAGDRVAVHYLATCGTCRYCTSGHEQFCPSGAMIGKDRPGGYAEHLVVPAASLVRLPESIPFEHGAVMMCSTATSFHALRKGRLQPGERVAVFGAGGLGLSAVQLARLMGATDVYAVDIRADKLDRAARYGARPVAATDGDPVAAIRQATGGEGVDVALELVGVPATLKQAVRCLAKLGRAVMVGLATRPFEVHTYVDLLGNEAEIIGCSDHLKRELPTVLEYARQGRLDFSHVVTRTIPLDADAINDSLASLARYGDHVRTVITP
jgi:2-desacetyl-2-hydroxyethyl bacteriochlorophyllide A dehydrogenase